MLKVKVYSVNFKYDGEGNIDKIEVSFGTEDNTGNTYLNGYVTLTEAEFNVSGKIDNKVVNKLIAVLSQKDEPVVEPEPEPEPEEEPVTE